MCLDGLLTPTFLVNRNLAVRPGKIQHQSLETSDSFRFRQLDIPPKHAREIMSCCKG